MTNRLARLAVTERKKEAGQVFLPPFFPVTGNPGKPDGGRLAGHSITHGAWQAQIRRGRPATLLVGVNWVDDSSPPEGCRSGDHRIFHPYLPYAKVCGALLKSMSTILYGVLKCVRVRAFHDRS